MPASKTPKTAPYVLGNLNINLPAGTSPEAAAEEIVACTSKRSNMYKGILAMLKKEPHQRTEFETLVRTRLGYWEPLDDDYEYHCSEFTDYEL